MLYPKSSDFAYKSPRHGLVFGNKFQASILHNTLCIQFLKLYESHNGGKEKDEMFLWAFPAPERIDCHDEATS